MFQILNHLLVLHWFAQVNRYLSCTGQPSTNSRAPDVASPVPSREKGHCSASFSPPLEKAQTRAFHCWQPWQSLGIINLRLTLGQGLPYHISFYICFLHLEEHWRTPNLISCPCQTLLHSAWEIKYWGKPKITQHYCNTHYLLVNIRKLSLAHISCFLLAKNEIYIKISCLADVQPQLQIAVPVTCGSGRLGFKMRIKHITKEDQIFI